MSTEKFHPEIKIEGIAPLLYVFDMPTSLKFYRDVLGFKVVMSSEESDDANWVLLRLNDIELMLNTAYEAERRPEEPDPERINSHGDTYLYFGCPDTDALYEHLTANNINVNKPEITIYNWKALNFKDPDGYGLCFHWPLQNS
ncbi:MAG TPA: VOC family protein [Mucilaginibacter sp.]|nr:VOC family protein [Mucilaginibacter sp.]